MDYKKIIKKRSTRQKVLKALSFIPDEPMVRLQYWIKTGRLLNLKNPKRYTEKLQWYKLNYKDPLMAKCVDKYDVREYVESLGLESILNDCYGVFNSAEEVDFEVLPNSFVLKDSLGGGGNSVIICKDKAKANLEDYRALMRIWVNKPRAKTGGREWPYYSGKSHRIVVEKYLEQDDGDLPDFKFFCFDGKVFCVYLMTNYRENHDNGILGFLDRDFNLLPVHRADFKPLTVQPQKPENYQQMVEYAEILSKAFPHVRVDFFNINGQIVFGELTFFMASGYFMFEPDSFDYEMGRCFKLPKAINKSND